MKSYSRLFVFLLALSLGLIAASGPNEHTCPRFGGIDPNERFFTLAEGKQLLGARVRYSPLSAFPDNKGRIAALDLIETDRFFIIVDWEITPDNGGPGLRWYSKDGYDRLLVPE